MAAHFSMQIQFDKKKKIREKKLNPNSSFKTENCGKFPNTSRFSSTHKHKKFAHFGFFKNIFVFFGFFRNFYLKLWTDFADTQRITNAVYVKPKRNFRLRQKRATTTATSTVAVDDAALSTLALTLQQQRQLQLVRRLWNWRQIHSLSWSWAASCLRRISACYITHPPEWPAQFSHETRRCWFPAKW